MEKNPVVGGYAHGDGEQGFSWDHGGHVLLAYRLGSAARRARRGGRGPRAWLGGAASEDADGPPPLA